VTAETPADTIRRAAALMRQRAEAASPGPWHVELLGAKGYPQRISNASATVIGQTYTSPTYAPANAEHIASWHPLVALAAAVVLEAIATEMDDYGVTASHVSEIPLWTAAHDLACTYLGEVDHG
jgi:hypothetical protein